MAKYEFKSTGNEEIDKVILQLDKKIKAEYKYYKKSEKCPSYLRKQLFLKTEKLSLNDWRIIRGGDYWEIRDSLQGFEQTKFIYNRVSKYLNANG